MRDVPRPGDRVRVPFGGEFSDAVVEYVTDLALGRYVAVEVEVEGADPAILSMYRIEEVEPAAPAA